MKNAMNKILANSGMSDSLSKPEPIPCEVCGMGRPQTQIEHPFKKVMTWVHCACPCVVVKNEKFWSDQKNADKQIKINRALKLSSAMEDIKSMTFDNFQGRSGTKAAYEEIMSAVKNFDKRGKLGVFIFGETGNGKSHITASGGNALIKSGYAVIYITEKDLFSRLQATKNFKNTETFGEIMGACLDADLLIWDDFMSSQKLSADEKDWIFQIVNGRERANKPIWMTSNITPEEFESGEIAYQLDDKGRTWWRIIGNMNCVLNQAVNYRKSKAMARALDISVEEYEKRIQEESN
ncbi:ATP-binding protein [Sporosarcina sp. FA9]|uniref:ATP-binding protein n=1 Tax=Sporosarcina sp. FA9 TaxID=3413030 RepID=UPI003F6565CE